LEKSGEKARFSAEKTCLKSRKNGCFFDEKMRQKCGFFGADLQRLAAEINSV